MSAPGDVRSAGVSRISTRVIASRPRPNWGTAHLRSLSASELSALVGVMPAWLHRREWRPPAGCDKDLLWEFVERHGLGGALGALAAEGLVADEEIAPRALDRYLSNSLHFEDARRICGRIARSANHLGVPVLNMKGPVLAGQAYGDTGIRAFSDIDLWTNSRSGLLGLLHALDARIVQDNDLLGPVRRSRGPGSIEATIDRWEIEARYPTVRPTDPMLELLFELGPEHWRAEEGCLAAPDPSMHLLILLFHLSWYHYFSRFVWFLDLAALVSRRRDEIDLDWVQFQAQRLNTANVLGIVALFCRRHIDAEFPSFPLDTAAWNFRFLNSTLDSSVIAAEKFSLHQHGLYNQVRILWFRSSRHYLLADPAKGHPLDSRPLYWLTATITWALRCTGRAMYAFFRLLAWLLLYPAARLTGWISQKPFDREALNGLP
jgi:hypothetical protein